MTTSAQQRGLDLSSLRCAAGTDVGMRREENQDSFVVVRHAAFQGFFVADGMGGVKGGAIASRLAVSVLEQELSALSGPVTQDALITIVSTINAKIFEQGTARPELAGMGTTLVGLVFLPEGMLVINVGDSRAYRVRGDSISQISEDHTLVRELVRSGAISSQEADHHPVSHMLTRSLGPLAEVVVECRRESVEPREGDIYVLCSDGLYNFVQDNEILDVVRQNPLDDANQILINLANRRGGTDNITVVVVSIGDSGGRRGGQDFRHARAVSGSAVSNRDSEPADPLARDSHPERVVREEAPSIGQEPYPVVAPRVEEPRDHYAEREVLKELKRRIYHQSRGMPVTLMLGAAVIFGLVVGDVARRWGAFPDLLSMVDGGSMSSRSRSERDGSVTKLDDLTKELALNRSFSGAREGLPDIARRVGGSDFAPSIGRGRVGLRHRSLNKGSLESAAAKIETQLTMLSVSSPDIAAAALQRAQSQRDSYSGELEEIESQIDIASRRLSLWFGRKKRIESEGQELFQPGGDMERVGAISERVKKRVAEWTEATYRLQAKQDEFELYPSNEELRREVERLTQDRSQIQNKLREDVGVAIDGVLAETYRQLEDLKVRRDIVATQTSNAQEEVEFLKTVVSPDESARAALRRRLDGELADIRGALAEMKGE